MIQSFSRLFCQLMKILWKEKEKNIETVDDCNGACQCREKETGGGGGGGFFLFSFFPSTFYYT